MRMNKKLLSLLYGFLLLVAAQANATILWAGGEYSDLEVVNQLCVSNNGYGAWRTSYARFSLYNCGGGGTISKGYAFKGGAVTSAWVSAWVHPRGSAGAGAVSAKFFGLGKVGTNDGILVGASAANANKIALWKLDGGVWTELASEAGASIVSNATYKIDVQLISYGSSGTVKIYISASANPIISYTGNISTAATTNLDSVFLVGPTNSYSGMSEFIVADQDTRLLSLATLTPNAAGDLSQWTGAYTDIDESTANDTDVVNATVSGNVFQCNLSNLPVGSWQVHGVKVNARATKVGSGISSMSLGLKTNGANHVPAPVSLGATWTTVESVIFNTNPVTTTNWTPTDINALQLHLEAAP